MPLIISRMSSKVKVIGERSRAPFWQMWFSDVFYCVTCVNGTESFCYDIKSHVTSQHDVMMSCDVTEWHLDIIRCHLGKNTNKEGTSREGESTLRRFHWKYVCVYLIITTHYIISIIYVLMWLWFIRPWSVFSLFDGSQHWFMGIVRRNKKLICFGNSCRESILDKYPDCLCSEVYVQDDVKHKPSFKWPSKPHIQIVVCWRYCLNLRKNC